MIDDVVNGTVTLSATQIWGETPKTATLVGFAVPFNAIHSTNDTLLTHSQDQLQIPY